MSMNGEPEGKIVMCKKKFTQSTRSRNNKHRENCGMRAIEYIFNFQFPLALTLPPENTTN